MGWKVLNLAWKTSHSLLIHSVITMYNQRKTVSMKIRIGITRRIYHGSPSKTNWKENKNWRKCMATCLSTLISWANNKDTYQALLIPLYLAPIQLLKPWRMQIATWRLFWITINRREHRTWKLDLMLMDNRIWFDKDSLNVFEVLLEDIWINGLHVDNLIWFRIWLFFEFIYFDL